MSFELQRFVAAQAPVIEAVRTELRAGQKRTHWMWFVFPQLRGLASSPTAQLYALSSRREAQAFLDHPVLGPRLIACTTLVNRLQGRDVPRIFGSPDDRKFHSCMTLFDAIQTETPVFRDALARYFGGATDVRTLELLAAG